MAMGLAMIVSDVGSIRDYCDNSNSIFCTMNIGSFVTAIQSLSLCPNKVELMKKSSLEKARQFNIDNLHLWFSNL